MKNFLLPWLNKEKSPLVNLPNNPINKLEQSSSFNTPDGGFLQNKAPMTPIPHMSENPNAQKYKSEPPMTKIPQISNTSRQNFSAPMSIAPKMSIIPQENSSFELPSFTDFQNQNFIPDPLKSFTPTYNVNKPKLEIPREQSKINEKNKVISNNYNKKRNAMYSFMADVQKNDWWMTREMIEEHYPEFVDNIESALQLQAEIAPIVSKWEAVKLSEIQKYYPELLSEPKFLKKSEVKKKDNEAKEYLKRISNVDQSVLSDEGKKWWGLMQGMQDLATQVRAQYQVPKDITDTEITNYVISNNPELKKRYKDGINANLTDYDKAQLKLWGNWMNKFSATAQNLTHRANTWLSENVIEPYMQASEEFKETNPNLSAINAPVKALLQIPGGLLHGTDKALSSMQRLANADYQSAGEIVWDGIKGLWGAGEIAFNTALAPLTAKFHTLWWTKVGKAVLDNTFGLLEEGLENIFQAPGVSKLYNALDEEARADLKNGIIIWLLHKGNKATEKTRFNAKMAIKTATDVFNNAIQKGINSWRFQIWVENGPANENGKFQNGALGRIVKEGVSEFQSAFTENIWKFSDVLKTRRQQVNTLTDQRGFVETTKSEIKEGVESVKKWAKNVWSAIKAGTENLVGGIKKKINDLNTKSPVKQQGEIKEWSAWSEGKINDKDSTQKFSNFNRKFLQNQNRIDPSKIVEFEKRTGKKYGDYMLERGRVGLPEENVGKMTEYINTLKEQKRQAFEKMSGTAQSEAIGTLLTDIVERATQVRDPQSGKFTTMLTKHNEWGISFSELEEAKRRYERNIKTWYYKDNNSVGIQRATNLDSEIRQYQQQEAIKQGFANIKELNKEISNAYFLSDNILKKQLKMDANNQVSLTDYLLLWAMPDNATWFAGLALKIAMKNKSVKNAMLHAVARLFGNHKNSKKIKVDLEKIEKMADQKSVADAIERFMKKWNIEEPKALPKTASATVIGKNWPQVKNPLSPQPTRKSVIELDKRPKNTKESDKKNVVWLKKTTKSWNLEKTEHTMGDKETAQPAVSFSSENEPVLGVSFFAKEKWISSKKKNIIGLFSEQIGGTKQDWLNPNALPLSDYKAMQSLEGLTTPLQKKDMQWYITEKIAQDKGTNKFWSPEEIDVYSDIAGLVKDMLYEYKNWSIEEANRIATSLFVWESAKSIINTYTEKYHSDLKVYERLSKKYPWFEGWKIDLWKFNKNAEKSQRVESWIYEEAKKYKTAEDFMASKWELLYHGSPNKFDTFSKDKIWTTTDQWILGKWFYFANKEYFAKGFAKGENGNIIKVRINSGKMFDINSLKTIEQASKMFQMDENAFYRTSDGKIIPKNFKYALKFGERLQEMGFDGAYLNRNADLKETVIFNPEVIQTEKELLKIRNEAQSEKKSNILWNLPEPKREAFETLPSDVDFLEESKKIWPKRIAPDRKAHQQLDPQTALEKLADKEKDRLTGKIKGLKEDLATLNKLVEKYGEKMPARTEKNRQKYPDLMKDYSEMQQLRTRYQSNSADWLRDIIKRIIDNNTHNLEEITPEDMKKEYIALVQEDISKGYKYPEAVLDFVPEARKILNGRERYEKGLYTSFSAKDERINYEYKEKLGAGMKRQDGKELTQEQKQDIVDGVEDFWDILGLDMKKLWEEKSWVYVHLNGKNVFLKNGVAGLYREKGENISISVGGTESVRQTIGGEVWAVKIHPTMAHELGHALDGIQNWKLFPSSKLFGLKIKMNKAPNWNTRYWKSDSEVTARAIEQYVAIKKGNTDYYDKPAYWKKEAYESIIEPMVKEEIGEKFEGYMKWGEHSKPLPKTTQDSENAMIWVSDKTSKKMHELSEKYPSAGKNELDKIGKLNSGIKKWSGKRSEKDKEIYRVKDDILLDDIIEKGISIKDEWEDTTYTLEQDGVYVRWHLWDRVRRILKKKWLLK